MLINWLFSINSNYWSTKAVNYDSQAYSAKVISKSWKGITQRYSLDGRLIAPNDISFEISNVDGALSRSDLEGYDLLVQLTMTDDYLKDESGSYILDESGNQIIAPQKYRKWKFKCKRAVPAYGKITCHCVDFVQEYLNGTWPNTKHPKELNPSDDFEDDELDNTCVPVVLGTAYIPVASVWDGTNRRYVLGDDTTATYTITEVTSPRDWPVTSTWDNTYTYNTENYSDHKVAELVIADSDGDGTEDANGVWISGSKVLTPLIKYSRDDTSSLTSPEEWIEYILEDYGVASVDIDTGGGSTFETVGTTLSGRGISWGGGFWKKEDREQLLQSLLSQIDGYIAITDKIELYLFDDTSQETIDKTKTVQGSFRSRPITQTEHDGGRVAWVNSGDPQDQLPGKSVVPLYEAQASISAPSSEVLKMRFETDSQIAQKTGLLYFQKKYLQKDRISFSTDAVKLTSADTLRPGQVITLDDTIFGASFDIIIESLSIKRDLKIDIQGVRLEYCESYADISASEVIIVSDGSDGWKVAIVDPAGVMSEKVNWSKVQDDDTNKPDDNADVTLDNLYVLTVSPTAGKAKYTSISDALSAVENDYTLIYLKNGTYSISSGETLPNYNVTFQGESRKGVILQMTTDLTMFTISNAKEYTFRDITFDADSNSGTHIYSNGSSAYSVFVDNCEFIQKNSTSNENGISLTNNGNNGSAKITNSDFQYGNNAIALSYLNDVFVSNCVCDTQHQSIICNHTTNARVSSCKVTNFSYTGIQVSGNQTGDQVVVTNCTVKSIDDTLDQLLWALDGGTYGDVIFANNNVIIDSSRTSTTESTFGIRLRSGASAKNNTIDITTTSKYFVEAIYTGGSDCNITGNNIYVDASDTTEYHNGIAVNWDDTIISDNLINMVNSSAKDYGIYLDSDTDDCYGEGNIVKNAGTDLADNGTGNNIGYQSV